MTVKEKLENGTFRDYQDILKVDSNNSCPFVDNYNQEGNYLTNYSSRIFTK